MLAFLFICLFFLLLIGMPVALALAIPSVIYFILTDNLPNFVAIQAMVGGANSYPLLAIPFFIFAGNLMNTGGITNKIFDFSNKIVGHIKGGLGHVNVIASIFFAGMSGSAVADAGGLGNIEITAMRRVGYNDDLTIGVTAASATIGPIIPPSIGAVVYAVLASVSVGRLFAAGIIPGLIMGLSLMAVIYLLADKYNSPIEKKSTIKEIIHSFLGAFYALLIPGIILGGIFFGIFTPTEAASIASLYAIFLGFFVYREIGFKELWEAIRVSMLTTAQVMFIIVSATLFSWILTKEQVPQMVADYLLSFSDNYWVILVLINVILIIAGMFLNTLSAINILVPVLLPVIVRLGGDPIHFGIIMHVNLMIGQLTPPFGSVLFVLSSVAKVPVEKVIRSCMIFIPALLVALLLICLFPQLCLFLPNLIFG